MRKRIIIQIFIFLSCCLPVMGQNDLPEISTSLEKLFGRLKNNYSSQEKLAINDSIRTIIVGYSSSDTVFNCNFKNLRFLGQITSPDSLIKIITWNLILDDGENRYFCYVVSRTGKIKPAKVYTLDGFHREGTIRSDTIYSQSDWYGALYYDIRPFKLNGQVSYIVLGIDYGNSFITRKIIDILSFNVKNEIIFGKNCINDGSETRYRIVFEFASTAIMSLRFNTDRSVIFDHLAPFSAEYKDDHRYYGPDYSFDSYDLDMGVWRLKRNIDIRNKK
jgi:hypothetical protein